MKLIVSKKADINYLAKVIELKDSDFISHPNADSLKIALIGGYKVVVGLDEKPGLYIYFPALSKINENLLSFCNLYRHTEKNNDPEAKAGFFEDNGRVKAIKLRGVVFEGFLLPAESLRSFLINTVNIAIDKLEPNVEFDSVEHHGKEIWICKKYKVVSSNAAAKGYVKNSKSNFKGISKLVEGQFRKHYDTIRIEKDPYCIQPNDIIQISSKWDGTSQISGYILCVIKN